MTRPTNPQPDDFFYGDGDYEQAALEAAGRECSRRLRESSKHLEAGDLMAAAKACPHAGGYPLKSLAARNASDPREGEPGIRCHDCNSVVDSYPWDVNGPDNVGIIHPCEPRWGRNA